MRTQVLSVEQMQHLKELGVDTSKAKMAWYAIYETLPNWYNELNIRDDVFDKNYPSVPTFTLQDILEMLPDGIEDGGYVFFPTFKRTLTNWMGGYCNFTYGMEIGVFLLPDLLTCAYETLCWCAENGYLKGGENEKRD